VLGVPGNILPLMAMLDKIVNMAKGLCKRWLAKGQPVPAKAKVPMTRTKQMV
jgi:hypothetical protein